ncbi:uncharacterized protein K02A2.6-like [Armigeres subalbatus]|uniref:uncharacterized protein K02A2.6-like n=1 Tax=Armigeres subalbatus TaxID=124917 RepID=UPI002ED66AA0
MHFSSQCTFKNHRCHECGRTGHKDGYCYCFASKSGSRRKQQNNKKYASKIVTVKNVNRSRRYVETAINGVPVELQLDSGSDITIISKQNWINVGAPQTSPPNCKVQTASGQKLGIAAMFRASYTINGTQKEGSDLMDEFGLWDVPFSSFLHLTLKPDAQPIFKPKRPVSYNMEAIVEDELKRLEDSGIITPVTYADWAAPIVVVRKPDRSVRICADFSTGLNNALESNSYPLPLPEDIFNRMAQCTVFSHIDLSDAYLQVEVDEESKKMLTINTHKGLYRFNRLSPGVKTAPGAFQQIMDAMLSGIPGTCPYLDDIFIGGRNAEEHKRNLYFVLQRLQEYGFTRVHADFAGPLNDTYFLIVVDSFSKWPEVIPTKRITTAATIASLRKIFGRFGMPEVLVTDNGAQLTSDAFEGFCEANGIMHLKTAPFHPQSNGQAERFVDTFKRTVKKIQAGGKDLDEALDIFLSCYRSTPCRSAPGGKSPAEILIGRPMRISLELLRPPSNFSKATNSNQDRQFNKKHGAKDKTFEVQDNVCPSTPWQQLDLVQR